MEEPQAPPAAPFSGDHTGRQCRRCPEKRGSHLEGASRQRYLRIDSSLGATRNICPPPSSACKNLRHSRPRSYLLPERQCTQKPPDGVFTWLRPVWSTPDEHIIDRCGLDAYLFLRYIRMMLRIFLPVTLVALPVLVPTNYLSGELGTITSLNEFSISNVAPKYTACRMWAHWTLGTLVAGWVCYVIHDETLLYVRKRQDCLHSCTSTPKVSANTILVGNIPKDLLVDEKLKKIFGVLPGGVKDIRINTTVEGLCSKLSTREDVVGNLEVAETRLIALCVSRSMRPSSGADGKAETYKQLGSAISSAKKERRFVFLCFPDAGFLFCLWEVAMLQEDAKACAPTGSAFVQFNRRVAAHLACQSVIHGAAHRMTPRMLDVDPEDVVWANLALDWRQRWVRACIGLAISASVIVLYAAPVALTSLLGNLDMLASRVDWLSWLLEWPDVVKSFVQGVLPPALLQLLLLLVPVIYRGLVHFQGAPTGTAREVRVQNWHFVFLFVQVFLVVSISGGLINFLSGAADNPKSVPAELARSLPRAANYFMSYVLIKALTGSAGALLQPYTLLVHAVSPIVDISPRQIWQRQEKLSRVEWARLFPPLTNIAVIGIAFSVIAPLVVAFVSFAFTLYWLVHRYNVLYVYQYESDSGGRFFVAAINQLFAGLYVMEICLTGVFLLATGPDDNSFCIPQGLAMVAVLALTVAYQSFLNRTYRSLMLYLPLMEEGQDPVSNRLEPEDGGAATSGATSRAKVADGLGKSGDVRVCTVRSGVAAFAAKGERPVEHFRPRNRSDDGLRDGGDLGMHLRARTSSPTVWIPHDELGVSRSEIGAAAMPALSVKMSDDGALLDERGRVTIEKCPPEQESLTELNVGCRMVGEEKA
ncbi:hypothetical protein Q7P37_009845 [Cladosporium fusiforme]